MPAPTTARNGAPDLVTSPIAAAAIVAELREHAAHLADGRLVRDLPRLLASRVRAILRTARQVEELHAADGEHDDLDADLDAHLVGPVEHPGGQG